MIIEISVMQLAGIVTISLCEVIAMLPLKGTEIAAKWDDLYLFLLGMSVLFLAAVVGAMIYFAIRYRHQDGRKVDDGPSVFEGSGNKILKAILTVIPLLLVMVIFGWGYSVYRQMIHAPPGSIEIKVIAKQWQWQFQYDDGKTTIDNMYVPVNRPIKLIMSSEDVIHSLFVPNFRLKQDVVPGMYTSVWFEAAVPGRHKIYCAEYCGLSHSAMLADLYVLGDTDWEKWKQGLFVAKVAEASESVVQGSAPAPAAAAPGTGGGPAQTGKAIIASKSCIACHSDDGTKRVGPSFKGIFGHQVKLADGSTAVVDENYIRESIQTPQAKLVEGFGPLMPPFKVLVTDEEINAIIAYIKSLR